MKAFSKPKRFRRAWGARPPRALPTGALASWLRSVWLNQNTWGLHSARMWPARARATAPEAGALPIRRVVLAKILCGVFAVLLLAGTVCADTIEFMNGSQLDGKVRKIDAAAKTVAFDAVVAGRTLSRSFPQSQVHAVTIDGVRTVLTAKAGTKTGSATRTPAEVQKLIKDVGSTDPDWLATTTLNYPKGLDLNWPMPPPQPWNNQKNVGQFIWDIVNPNENRWREGIKFMHHLLTLHQKDPVVKKRVMQDIGGMHFRFFQDYARAAWWFQQAGVQKEDPLSLQLAECYWRLGSKQMAKDMMAGQSGRVGTIKLLGDMGETDAALKLADWFARAASEPQEALVQAGDACRLAGRYQQALSYYQKTIQAKVDPSRKERMQRYVNRAQASIDAIKLFELSDVAKVADGTYQAESLGYNGQVQVAVSVKAHRIESVKVTKHNEKQFYSALRDVPAQIISKQSVKGVEATSRATITGDAILNATAKALAKGSK